MVHGSMVPQPRQVDRKALLLPRILSSSAYWAAVRHLQLVLAAARPGARPGAPAGAPAASPCAGCAGGVVVLHAACLPKIG